MSYRHLPIEPSEPDGALRSTADEVGETIQLLLDAGELTADERVELLGGLLAVEALRPYWRPGGSPADAQAALRQADGELADAVESLAPLLLGRAQAREDAAAAIADVESLLR